jgi:hypothetical protein
MQASSSCVHTHAYECVCGCVYYQQDGRYSSPLFGVELQQARGAFQVQLLEAERERDRNSDL